MGLTLRRLVSKLVNSYAIDKVSSSLTPIQLGVGVAGGAEAAVHAVRHYVENLRNDEVVIKLVFSNAFNTLHRGSMLETVQVTLPEAYSYVHASYACLAIASILRGGNYNIR